MQLNPIPFYSPHYIRTGPILAQMVHTHEIITE